MKFSRYGSGYDPETLGKISKKIIRKTILYKYINRFLYLLNQPRVLEKKDLVFKV